MGFLRPKMPAPPPPPPPPPPIITQPDPVIRPATVVEATQKKAQDKKKVNPKTAIQTSPMGVLDDTPLEYKSLLGGGTPRKTKKPGA